MRPASALPHTYGARKGDLVYYHSTRCLPRWAFETNTRAAGAPFVSDHPSSWVDKGIAPAVKGLVTRDVPHSTLAARSRPSPDPQFTFPYRVTSSFIHIRLAVLVHARYRPFGSCTVLDALGRRVLTRLALASLRGCPKGEDGTGRKRARRQSVLGH